MVPEPGPTRPTSLALANYIASSPRALTDHASLSHSTDAAMKDAAIAVASVPATKIVMPASAAGPEAALLGKGRYKVWAFVAIALLALWSMSAASVSLRWSASGDLAVAGDLDVPLGDDLDSLVRVLLLRFLSSQPFCIWFVLTVYLQLRVICLINLRVVGLICSINCLLLILILKGKNRM